MVEYIRRHEGESHTAEEWFKLAECAQHVKRMPEADVRVALIQMMCRESRLSKRGEQYVAPKGAGRHIG